MEEKKLTDEDIAQALLQNIEYGKAITYFDKWGNHKSIMIADILDFIHRLQAENERLKCNSYKTSWKAKFFKAKAEIERLTEENNILSKVIGSSKRKTSIYELQKQVDELTIVNANLIKRINRTVKDTAKDIFAEILDRMKKLKAMFESPFGDYRESKEHLVATIEIEIEGIKNLAKQYGVEVE